MENYVCTDCRKIIEYGKEVYIVIAKGNQRGFLCPDCKAKRDEYRRKKGIK